MINKAIRRVQLVKGGTVIKQGEIFTLGFQLFDADGAIIIPTAAQVITVKIANRSGVVYETTAKTVDDHIEFTVDKDIGHGETHVELKVTEGTTLIQKYPADGFIKLKITGSLDDLGVGGVGAITVTQLRQEQTTLQTEYEKKINPKIAAVEVKAADLAKRVEDGIGAFTSSTEIVDARGGEVNLRSRLDKTAAQLAEKAGKADFNSLGINIKFPPPPLVAAKGDGVTDDQPAIQAVVNYVSANGGGKIFAPKGKYKLLRAINWETNVSLYGAGMGKTILYPVGTGFSAIQQVNETKYNPDNPLYDVTFADFEIDGTGFTGTVFAMNTKGIFILYMRRANFLNLYIHDTLGTGLGADFLDQTLIHGCIIQRCSRLWGVGDPDTMIGGAGIGVGTGIWGEETLTISDCWTINCGNHGIFVEEQGNALYAAKHVRIVNCVAIGGLNHGITDKGVSNLTVTGCTMSRNANYGFNIAANVKATEGMVQNCTITENGKSGVLIGQLTNARYKFSDNRIAYNTDRGIWATVSNTEVSGLTFTDNEIHDNGLPGITLTSATTGKIKNLVLAENNLFNNGKRNVSAQTAAILIEGNLEDFRIKDNRAFDTQATKTQARGIRLSSGFTLANGRIDANDFDKNIAVVGIELLGTVNPDVSLLNNKGYKNENIGFATIPDGSTSVTIPHGLVKPPTIAFSSARGNTAVWISTIGTSSIIISRTGTTGALIVDWSARV